MADSKPAPTVYTVFVEVTCNKKNDDTPFFRVSEPRFRGEPESEFSIEWKVKGGCKAVLQSATATSGGAIHDFAVADSNGKKATARGVFDEDAGELRYNLCAKREGASGDELAFGQGELTSDIYTCKEAVAGPQPPPKIIGPPPLVGDGDDARTGEEDEKRARPVRVTIKRETWRGSGEKVSYFLAKKARRPKGSRTMEVEFKLPKDCEIHSVEPVSGGTLAPPGSQPNSKNRCRVRFEGDETLAYNVAVTDRAAGVTCYAYGQLAVSRPTCAPPDDEALAQGPPKPPPVIIGDP